MGTRIDKVDALTEVLEVREVMPEPEGGWPADEYTGKAGSYVRDPYTGVRRPDGDGGLVAVAAD